ncbi:circularly permuted type 2 ATP-grasp protein [Rufibacter quisquiliarum]|uniref:Putative circularly permuted ATP-grasp superfamily protein n=1 Tax=Rufibacter quisquiliarum TaxID=1549639 RepID=A0A839GTT8_9BACT|nr:circularly permuted type 2 ATP-grasp protein [Rufibacter quisquiliarum]MBA9077201.1 putative circularly permuted ATP-grasp superfamily protein [Rufibacter quisquiliarum]
MDAALRQNQISDVFKNYQIPPHFLDEVFQNPGEAHPHYQAVFQQFLDFTKDEFKELNEHAKMSFFNQGITFSVYSEEAKGVERIFPFDLFPRIIPASEWARLEEGIIQRCLAMNLFIEDIYTKQHILRDKVVPAELIFSSKNYLKAMLDIKPVGGIYNHISGTDLIKHRDGQYYVLEDNLRCPSGISYVLSNRVAMKRTLFQLFRQFNVNTVHEYPQELLATMQSVAPNGIDAPTCVVLTPGVYNSAYFEHAFLALTMGVPLVEGRDLYVEKNFVYMKTINGPKRVDVVYRRLDDDFLDPMTFKPDSMLGVPGIMAAYKKGNVNLLNAPGTGFADDKAVYAYVPDIIRYYLQQEPILNNVHTYRCEKEDDLAYVLENMDQLVVKPVDESGGYGILIGNKATKEQLSEFRHRVTENRRKYIAQPIMALSMHATFIEGEDQFEPRHVDLRTFTLLGKDRQFVLKGGLSRVALKKGSLIVNSSQGGGSKDTWVLMDDGTHMAMHQDNGSQSMSQNGQTMTMGPEGMTMGPLNPE